MSITYMTPGSQPLPPAPCTSVEIYARNLAAAMQHLHPVTLYAKGAHKGRRRDGCLTIRTLRTKGGLSYLRQVLREQKKHPPRLIQIENRPAFAPIIKRAFPHIPLVLNLHSNVLIQALPLQTVRKSFEAIDAMVVNSHYLQRFLLARYPDLAAEKIHVIHPAIHPAHFPSRQTAEGQKLRARMRQKLAVTQGNQVVLYVGRMIPRKGLSVLLDAFRLVHRIYPKTELWLIGGRLKSTAFHQSLRRQAQGLPVRFLGYISQNHLPAYYLAADLFVCPSQRPEAFGMVNIEAAASGLPIVASANWGIQESVQEGRNGLLVRDYKSAAAFAKPIAMFLASPAQRQSFGIHGRAFVEREFSWQQNALRFQALYKKIWGMSAENISGINGTGRTESNDLGLIE